MVTLIAIGCGALVVLLVARTVLSEPLYAGQALPPGDVTLEAASAVRSSTTPPPLELVVGDPGGESVVHGARLPVPEASLSLLGIAEDPHADDQIYSRVREKLGKS